MEKDKIIAMQRKKIEELSKKVSAMEQEIELLKHEKSTQKKVKKSPSL
ncbi:MAG: hypothetical protein GX102_04775 [Porphyromonadaceae bacterium]|jgi:uncharacterized coiled-coil protein SlyX|nr:hypothetical protein [Porphyromonadaceae bacterium]